jgi:hypothetical protein
VVSRALLTMTMAFWTTTTMAQSTLVGTVRHRGDSTAIGGAQLAIPQLGLQATTDHRGRFRLEDIPAGRYVVVARLFGYDSSAATLAFSGADDVKRDFELVPLAQPLPPVPVTGKQTPILNAKLSQFEERRRYGIGRFLAAADLEKDQDTRLSNVLAKLPGIQIVTGRPSNKGGSPMAAYVASSRGAFSIYTESAFFGTKCPVAIWLDGIPVYRGNDQVVVNVKTGQVRSLGPEEPPYDINQIHTRQVAAMEFYAGPSQIPAQFNITQGTCGALIIWTK